MKSASDWYYAMKNAGPLVEIGTIERAQKEAYEEGALDMFLFLSSHEIDAQEETMRAFEAWRKEKKP